MTALSFFGNAFTAYGPALAVFLLHVGKQAQLVILLMTSAFFWLLSILVTSIFWYIITPLQTTPTATIFLGVTLQEGFRYLFFLLMRKAETGLNTISHSPTSRFNRPNNAFVTGLGFGAMSGLISYIPQLAESSGPAILESQSCPGMDVFFLGAFVFSHSGVASNFPLKHVEMPTEIKSICVFCGSRPGTNPRYMEQALALGVALAESKISLVYGGGDRGLMGAVARSVSENMGHVTGFIPSTLTQFEGLSTIGTTHIVSSMHERKRRMAESSDAFVALPGGFGTFEEVFEMITWSQLRMHGKPIGVLNVDGFFDMFLGLVDRAVRDGFVDEVNRGLVVVKDTIEELLSALKEFEIPEGAQYKLDWTKEEKAGA
ncbi:hypothetical protein HKX48_004963 [Thoreauomyces humboldtii]|nr:hypothetical protein HKX48_004963 [Thoreauomyces humboldtii]